MKKKSKPNSATLHDAASFRYFFLLRWQHSDRDLVKHDHSESVWSLVRLAWRWLRERTSLTPKMPPVPRHLVGRRESQRLAGTPWLASADGSMEFSLESRSVLDSAYIQLGVWRHGRAEPSAFQSLQQLLADFRVQQNLVEKTLLGEIDCLYAEVADLEQANQFARRILRERLPDSEDEVSVCIQTWGCLAASSRCTSPFVVLATGDRGHIESASWVINFLLPRLSLAYLKIEYEFHRYEDDRPEIEESERLLAANLEGRVAGGNLGELEQSILQLSESQDLLVEKLSKLSQKVIGMETNLRNIEIMLGDAALVGQYQTLWQLFGEPGALAIEQIKVDMNYFRARKEESQLAAQTLRAFIEVESARTDRLMVAILGVIGLVLSLIDGFADALSVTARAAILGLGTVVVLALWFVGKKRRRRDS